MESKRVLGANRLMIGRWNLSEFNDKWLTDGLLQELQGCPDDLLLQHSVAWFSQGIPQWTIDS
jgi:hypothetical protein